MLGFDAWDQPLFIVAVILVGVGTAWFVLRVSRTQGAPPFSCLVCGRAQRATSAREWRYCPWCGAPKSAKSLRQLPRGR